MKTTIGVEAQALAIKVATEKDRNRRAVYLRELIGKITVLDAAAALFLDYKDLSDRQQEVIQTVKDLGITIAIGLPEITTEHLNED